MMWAEGRLTCKDDLAVKKADQQGVQTVIIGLARARALLDDWLGRA